MHEYKLDIDKKSIWYTATPTAAASAFPFFITEAGRFFSGCEYFTERSELDSFMLIYTVSGSGTIQTENMQTVLSAETAVMLDCREYHKYFTNTDVWDFLWLHINGACAEALFRLLYPEGVHSITVQDSDTFEELVRSLVRKMKKNSLVAAAEISSGVHELFNMLIASDLNSVKEGQRGSHSGDIDSVIAFIKENYSNSITVDDMISDIHISKYHFIRMFRRIMGVTPYSYLMNYRINRSKLMLRSDSSSIADIAAECGFADTSNFISQFKKHTGQKPTQYRRIFFKE